MPARVSIVIAESIETVKVGRLTTAIARCPCAFMWPIFLLSVVLGLVGFRRIEIEVSANAGLDSDTLVEQVDYMAWVRGVAVDPRVYDPTSINGSSRAESNSNASAEGPFELPITFLYEGLSSNGVATSATDSTLVAEPRNGRSINVLWGPRVRSWLDPDNQYVMSYLFKDMQLAALSIILVIVILVAARADGRLDGAGF